MQLSNFGLGHRTQQMLSAQLRAQGVADASLQSTGFSRSCTICSNSRSRQMRSDSGAKSQLSRLAFRKPAMLAVA